MRTISRRKFLAGSAAVVLGACSDDSGADTTTPPTGPPRDTSTPPTATTFAGRTTIRPSTTEASTTTPRTTEPARSTVPATTTALQRDPFTLGVASGDPDATSVVLWTRLAVDPLVAGGGMSDADVAVRWEVSRQREFTDIVASGETSAVRDHAHSVHEVVALRPGWWYYRFHAGGFTSPIGRTRVAPAPGSSTATEPVTFASASCQNYEGGFYTAHCDLAQQQPDFVVWLGDYIYESANGTGGAARAHGTPEPVTLDEYRSRYGLYKLDADLQSAHHACPWFAVWDDHEVENNYAGLVPVDPAEAPGFPARRLAAYQAWWEHLPVRLPPPVSTDDEYRIYREVHWGDLLGIALLDGRQYRTDQACGDVRLDLSPACPEVTAPGRTMTGDVQEQWLERTLGSWGTTWNVIGNQVVLTDVTIGEAVLNYDMWDGYPAERARILAHLAAATVPNVVVLTGDIHAAAVGQLRAGERGTGPPVGVEFVTTSVSSASNISADVALALAALPDVVDAELVHRGYILHTVTASSWRADYRIVADATIVDSAASTRATYTIDSGTNVVRFVGA